MARPHRSNMHVFQGGQIMEEELARLEAEELERDMDRREKESQVDWSNQYWEVKWE